MSWAEVQLESITEVVTKGTTPTTYGMPFTDEGINFVKAESLNGDVSLERSGFAFISADTHEKLKRSQLAKDDVLITIAGANVGKCGIVREEDLPANTNQAVGIIRVSPDKALPKFVHYHFKTPSVFSICQSVGGQAAQPNINLTVLKGMKLKLPDFRVQRKIVEILSAYDDAIRNTRRRIQLLEESARLLYREWFVYLRFPGHEHVKILDGVPDGWIKKPLQDVAEINASSLKNSFQGKIEYIDISCVSTHSIDSTTWYEFEDSPGRARRKLKDKDIIWSCVRPNRKSHAFIWQPHDRLIASTGFAVISAKEISPFYLYQALTTNEYVGYLTNNAGGVAYPAVTAKVFEDSIVLVPPNSFTKNFDAFVEKAYQQIYVLQQANKKLIEARDLLLPRLMSGEISV